jgi:hypothetical protein
LQIGAVDSLDLGKDKGHRAVYAVAFSSDGMPLASACVDNLIQVCDVGAHKAWQQLKSRTLGVTGWPSHPTTTRCTR